MGIQVMLSCHWGFIFPWSFVIVIARRRFRVRDFGFAFFFVWVCGIYGAYNTTEQLGSHLLYNYVYYYLAG